MAIFDASNKKCSQMPVDCWEETVRLFEDASKLREESLGVTYQLRWKRIMYRGCHWKRFWSFTGMYVVAKWHCKLVQLFNQSKWIIHTFINGIKKRIPNWYKRCVIMYIRSVILSLSTKMDQRIYASQVTGQTFLAGSNPNALLFLLQMRLLTESPFLDNHWQVFFTGLVPQVSLNHS